MEGEPIEGLEVALAHREKKGSKVTHTDKKSKTVIVSQERGLEPATEKISETQDLEVVVKLGRKSPEQKDVAQRVSRTSGVRFFSSETRLQKGHGALYIIDGLDNPKLGANILHFLRNSVDIS